LWLYPPLAIARLGNSDTPLDAFYWGPNDDTPAGTGKTTLLPAETLVVAPNGEVSSFIPDTIRFKDEKGFRPVCPFFELHAEWHVDGALRSGPVTPAVLRKFGLDASKLVWRVEVAHLKPYFLTRDWRNRITASVELRGNDAAPRVLEGRSPQGSGEPLVPADHHVPLGTVRLTSPNRNFPEFRLRFTPGRGNFFGPDNLSCRWTTDVPPRHRFLNRLSSWCGWKPVGYDDRTIPGGQYAQDEAGLSLGLVDDTCDGIVSCSIEGVDLAPAHARVVVGPPDYAPDRRPLVSLADGLKDRVHREEVVDPVYLADMALAEREVRDIMERAFEMISLMNLDVLNDWAGGHINAAIARGSDLRDGGASDHYPFPPSQPTAGDPFPLTEQARGHHRRFISLEVFADFVRKRPDLIARMVRRPATLDPLFTREMPALMRGSTGGPLHLTRRQYDLLVAWAQKLQQSVEPGS
jgi:hypothetical protein